MNVFVVILRVYYGQLPDLNRGSECVDIRAMRPDPVIEIGRERSLHLDRMLVKLRLQIEGVFHVKQSHTESEQCDHPGFKSVARTCGSGLEVQIQLDVDVHLKQQIPYIDTGGTSDSDAAGTKVCDLRGPVGPADSPVEVNIVKSGRVQTLFA